MWGTWMWHEGGPDPWDMAQPIQNIRGHQALAWGACWPQVCPSSVWRALLLSHQVSPCHAGLSQHGTFLENPSKTPLAPSHSLSNHPLHTLQGMYGLVKWCICLHVYFLSLHPQFPSTSARGLCAPVLAPQGLEPCLAHRKCSLGQCCLNEDWEEGCEMTVCGWKVMLCRLACLKQVCLMVVWPVLMQTVSLWSRRQALQSLWYSSGLWKLWSWPEQTKEGISMKPSFFFSCFPPPHPRPLFLRKLQKTFSHLSN